MTFCAVPCAFSTVGRESLKCLGFRAVPRVAAAGGEASYTVKLLGKGAEHCAKKLGEEAVETAIAALAQDDLSSCAMRVGS